MEATLKSLEPLVGLGTLPRLKACEANAALVVGIIVWAVSLDVKTVAHTQAYWPWRIRNM